MKAQFVYENLDFERGQDPKDAMELGRVVRVRGDRGSGEFTVRLIEPYEGEDKMEDEEIWIAKDLADGEICYIVKYYEGHDDADQFFGEIDPFIESDV